MPQPACCVSQRQAVCQVLAVAFLVLGCSVTPTASQPGPSSATSAPVPRTTVLAIATTTQEPSPPSVPRTTISATTTDSSMTSWEFTEIDYTMREGPGYATGGRWLFAWGGRPDRGGSFESSGLLFDLETGEPVDVPQAPILGRYGPGVVWTGSDFVVFGGRSDDGPMVDGAAFDPAKSTWRTIAPAPFEAASHPAAAWIRDRMMIWVPRSQDESSSVLGAGTVALYDPVDDSWTEVDPPPINVLGVSIVLSHDRAVLIAGPNMRGFAELGIRFQSLWPNWASIHSHNPPLAKTAR